MFINRAVALIFFFILIPFGNLSAATFTVTSSEDHVDNNLGDTICAANLNGGGVGCTIRAAIQEANLNSEDDEIVLDKATYGLSGAANEDNSVSGDLDIKSNLTIKGQGSDKTWMDGGGVDRVFHIIGNFNVSFSDIAITDGVLNQGNGAGILNEKGNLNILNCFLFNNRNNGSSINSQGGAIYNQQGDLSIDKSIIFKNEAEELQGAGIFNDLGSLQIKNSTISMNVGASLGSGIFNGSNSLKIESSLITLNEATNGQAGGIFTGDNFEIHNSIVVGNKSSIDSSSTGDCFGGSGISKGFNIFGNAFGCKINHTQGDQFSVKPADILLGPLTDNGGPTDTQALLPGSPAIDAGDPDDCPDTDQRGVLRPQGGVCDIGPFEYEVVCGDGLQQEGEGCDDGNLDAGDGCDGGCKVESNSNLPGDTATGGCSLERGHSPSMTIFFLGIMLLSFGVLFRKCEQ